MYVQGNKDDAAAEDAELLLPSSHAATNEGAKR